MPVKIFTRKTIFGAVFLSIIGQFEIVSSTNSYDHSRTRTIRAFYGTGVANIHVHPLTRNHPHRHTLPNQSSSSEHKNKKPFLRCPHLPPLDSDPPPKLTVEFYHNTTLSLRIRSNGEHVEGANEVTEILRWRTHSGKLAFIGYGPAASKRRKFEFEEAKSWFALRIDNVTGDDIGYWRCKIKLRAPNGTIQHFESRKRMTHDLLPENRSRHQQKTGETSPTITQFEELDEGNGGESLVQASRSKIAPTTTHPLFAKGSTDSPLFMFSKDDDEYTVFSRIDNPSRDALFAYTRRDGDLDSDEPPVLIAPLSPRKNRAHLLERSLGEYKEHAIRHHRRKRPSHFMPSHGESVGMSYTGLVLTATIMGFAR